MTDIKRKNRRWSDAQILNEHRKTFVKWFSDAVNSDMANGESVSEIVRWLAHKPSPTVKPYSGYVINGYMFYTKTRDDNSTVQNSGVSLVGEALHVSSSKDKNPVCAKMLYYGVIQEIWEIDYVKFKETVFRCKWVDNKNGVEHDEMGFTLVDLNKEGDKEEPFILASQAKQVFYVADPCDNKWSVVLQGKKQGVSKEELQNDYCESPPFSVGLPKVQIFEKDDNVDSFLVRDDHDEGLYFEEPSTHKRKRSNK